MPRRGDNFRVLGGAVTGPRAQALARDVATVLDQLPRVRAALDVREAGEHELARRVEQLRALPSR
jgi:hypothetical protein